MNWNASTIESLRRVFTEGFAARDIAEPLVSFDACTAVSEVVELMDKRTFDVVGVRREMGRRHQEGQAARPIPRGLRAGVRSGGEEVGNL